LVRLSRMAHAHSHGHQHGAETYTMDWAEMAPRLAANAANEQGWYATMAADLVRPGDSVAVDVGCGGAGMTAALAAALNADALVVAADHSQAILDAARERLKNMTGLQARVEYAVVDLDDRPKTLPHDANLIWASASVHHSGDQQAAVDAL